MAKRIAVIHFKCEIKIYLESTPISCEAFPWELLSFLQFITLNFVDILFQTTTDIHWNNILSFLSLNTIN